MTAAFGVHHEWGKLREVVIGISPADDFVVFHEDSARWLVPPADTYRRAHTGRRLIELDPERARRIERQIDSLAELVAREGVTVHRPERLDGEERTFLAPNGEGAQLFPRDPMIVIGNHVIES
jgi:glycine amidinotransferase